jgi:hypothetical protein
MHRDCAGNGGSVAQTVAAPLFDQFAGQGQRFRIVGEQGAGLTLWKTARRSGGYGAKIQYCPKL